MKDVDVLALIPFRADWYVTPFREDRFIPENLSLVYQELSILNGPYLEMLNRVNGMRATPVAEGRN